MAMLIDENADKVIAQHESITAENDIFDRLMNACQEAQRPNKALMDAASLAREQGIECSCP